MLSLSEFSVVFIVLHFHFLASLAQKRQRNVKLPVAAQFLIENVGNLLRDLLLLLYDHLHTH